MKRASATACILLISILHFGSGILAAPAAEVQPTNSTDEGKFFLTDPRVIQECWKSFSLVPGCVDELHRCFTAGNIVGIGPACCKVINEVADKCFPNLGGIYPFNPVFAPMIKAHCKSTSPAPAAL